MSGFNAFYDGDEKRSVTRTIKIEVDLRTLPLTQWTDDELGLRLAVVYSNIDGYGHLTASEATVREAKDLIREIERRGYDWTSNLRYNERFTGWGWLPGFLKKAS